MKKLFLYIILLFQIIIVSINSQQYVPMGRRLHTAALIGTRIYYVGGLLKQPNITNDFFYLDISKPFDARAQALPFVDLKSKASEIPPHYGAAAAVFGESKDSIFLFGGASDVQFTIMSALTFSFNTTQSEWNTVIPSQNNELPKRTMVINAVTDNSNNKIYIFGGGFSRVNPKNSSEYVVNSVMNIFDTIHKVWTVSESGLFARDGYTSTFLPDTEEIIYIGGSNLRLGLSDTSNLDIYNTKSNTWSKKTTRNPPESRHGHSAVLTNDKRIIVFGGADVEFKPVRSYYVVLDAKTFEWYYGNEDLSTRAPYRQHTATLYKDYMFISFGDNINLQTSYSNDVLIYKIGDYANFTLENNFINVNEDENNENIKGPAAIGVIVGIIIGSTLGITSLGFIGFITFKRYKKTRIPEFEHVLNI